MGNVRIRIGQEFKRTVKVMLPGEELDKPEEAELIVAYRDLSPKEQKALQEQAVAALRKVQRLQAKLKKGDVSEGEIDDLDMDDLQDLNSLFDKVVVRVENFTVEAEDGTPLEGKEKMDFIKSYKRVSVPILDKWRKESAGGKAELGNLIA